MLYLERRRASFTSLTVKTFPTLSLPFWILSTVSFYSPHYNAADVAVGLRKEKKRKEKSRKEEHKGGSAGGEFAQPQTRDTTAAVSSFHVDPVVDQNTVAGRVRSADRAGLKWGFRLQI